MIIAFDPGRNIGVAHVGEDGRLLRCEILDFGALKKLAYPPDATLVVGDGTGSRAIQDVLVKLELEVVVVDEEGTTLEARGLYLRDYPPRGLNRLLPKGLWSPPRPIDDYAAYAIALRYLRAEGR
ncbi:hypothetical protein BH24DEI2_BH24DEI2_10200 [soil metagenome]